MYRGALELWKLERAGELLLRATFYEHKQGEKRETGREKRRGKKGEMGRRGGNSVMHYATMDGSGI